MPRAERRDKRDERLGIAIRNIFSFEHHALNRDAPYIEIVPLPCMHFGHPAHVRQLFDWAVSYIASQPYRFGLFMEDMIEVVSLSGKAKAMTAQIKAGGALLSSLRV